MGRESSITYEQVAAVADALRDANVRPTVTVGAGATAQHGSMGNIHRLLQEWKATQERHTMSRRVNNELAVHLHRRTNFVDVINDLGITLT